MTSLNIIRIEHLEDSRLQDFTRLTDVALRKKLDTERGLYLAESAKVIERALAAGHRLRAVLAQESDLPKLQELLEGLEDVPVFVGESGVLEQLTGFHMHRGMIASVHRPELPHARELVSRAKRIIVLDNLNDHSNVGLIFRSVAALGADAVLLTPSCADPLYRRAVRLSMGAVLQVDWARIPRWQEAGPILHDNGFVLAAFTLHREAIDLADFVAHIPEKVALVFGNEGHGLGPAALKNADQLVTIPMHHGIDSLNVSTSAAIALWAVQNMAGRYDS
jgi:tRNA G18 (ribose-2'-O)-methylase SpoU